MTLSLKTKERRAASPARTRLETQNINIDIGNLIPGSLLPFTCYFLWIKISVSITQITGRNSITPTPAARIQYIMYRTILTEKFLTLKRITVPLKSLAPRIPGFESRHQINITSAHCIENERLICCLGIVGCMMIDPSPRNVNK